MSLTRRSFFCALGAAAAVSLLPSLPDVPSGSVSRPDLEGGQRLDMNGSFSLEDLHKMYGEMLNDSYVPNRIIISPTAAQFLADFDEPDVRDQIVQALEAA